VRTAHALRPAQLANGREALGVIDQGPELEHGATLIPSRARSIFHAITVAGARSPDPGMSVSDSRTARESNPATRFRRPQPGPSGDPREPARSRTGVTRVAAACLTVRPQAQEIQSAPSGLRSPLSAIPRRCVSHDHQRGPQVGQDDGVGGGRTLISRMRAERSAVDLRPQEKSDSDGT
jgi:hypothetical protein